MIRHFFSFQFLGFLGAGLFAALLHWTSRVFLNLFLPFWNAVLLAYIVGMLVAFILNRLYVFPKSNRAVADQARGFFLINIAFFPLVWVSSILFNMSLKKLGMQAHTEEMAHAMALAIPMIATFLFYKFIAFRAEQT